MENKFIFTVLFIAVTSLHQIVRGQASRYLYVTNRTSVFRLDVDSNNIQSTATVLYGNGTYFHALALNEDKQEMFWSDLQHRKIYRGSLYQRNQTVFREDTVGYVRSITIDWSSDIIYWTNSFLRHIEVATIDGKYKKTLFALNTDVLPIGIFADAKNGYLFWTDAGITPKIERSTLSGNDRKTLASIPFSTPMDIFLDYATDKLYWTDEFAERIESMNIDGSGQTTLHNIVLHSDTFLYPYSLAYYNEKSIFYFTDWINNGIYEVTNSQQQVIYHQSRFDEYISNIRLSGITKPSAVNFPCRNNQCSHMCVKNDASNYVCDCPTGMFLFNETTCKNQQKQYEIYFSDSYSATVNHVIKYVNQPGFVVSPLPLPLNVSLEYPVALDFHEASGNIYWVDHNTSSLYRMKQDGKDFKLVATDINAIAMEIDQLNDILFYVDRTINAIAMISLKNTDHQFTIRKYDFVNVLDISLYEELSYIFFADYGAETIGRINNDGSNITTYKETLFEPTGIAVDKIEKRIFWCDTYNNVIKSANFNFGDVRLIVKSVITESFFYEHFSEGPARPFSVAVLNDKVIWTDTYHTGIFATNKRYGGHVEYIAGGFNEPRNLHAFNDVQVQGDEKIYFFAFPSVSNCFRLNVSCQTVSPISEEIAACPDGFRETNFAEKCLNCTERLGNRYVCPCHDWSTCAQRTYTSFSCSTPSSPFIHFKVRECTRVIRDGYCPYNNPCTDGPSCNADQNCTSPMKCCKTQCGFKCLQPMQKTDHPCKVDNGNCSHFCFGTQDSYSCSCPDHMILNNDTKTCRDATRPDVILYIANISSLFTLTFDTPVSMQPNDLLVKEGNNSFLHAVEVDEKHQLVYWSDLQRHEIIRMTVYGSNKTSLFTYGIGYPEGIAVDWSSNNIYWTDNIMKLIEVATTDGKNRKVLFEFEQNTEPRALIVDPKYGYLYWTDWGQTAKIERSSLAGTDRKLLMSSKSSFIELRWPNDLAIDYTRSKIYWVDAYYDYIGSMNFDGTGQTIIKQLTFGSNNVHPFSLTYDEDENVAYITDWATNTLYRMSPFSSQGNLNVVYRNRGTSGKLIRQVRVFNKNNPSVASPCMSNPCSHLCLKLNATNFLCDCPTGMQKIGEFGCQLNQQKKYEMFFADSLAATVNHLTKFKNQAGFVLKSLPNPSYEEFSSPVALDYHSEEENIYWIDYEKQNMYRMKVNGTNFKLLIKNITSQAIEIDEMSNVIYYCDISQRAIKLTSMDGKYTKTIKNYGLSFVSDIAIHEDFGYIFYSDIGHNIIARMDINGRNQHVYGNDVSNGIAIQATGLAVDKTENRIYWCDRMNQAIRSSDLEFKNTRTIVQKTSYIDGSFYFISFDGKVVEPFSIAILGDKIYWTDMYHGEIYETNKRTGGKIEFVTAGLDHPRDFHIFNDEKNDDADKMYYFSFPQEACHISNVSCLSSQINDPEECGEGYVQTNLESRCEICNETLGAKFVCPCNDWATCAHRTYSNSSCISTNPYLFFRVRECTKVVRYGYCPYNSPCSNGNPCKVDNDCISGNKCCKTDCDQKCVPLLMTPDHPCKVNNGNCSHFCFGNQYSYTCSCPDGMTLDKNMLTCSESSHINDILYFVNSSAVFELNITNSYEKKAPKVLYQQNGTRYFHAVAVDESKDQVYWSDYYLHEINQISTNGENKKSLFKYAIGNVQSITIDWLSENIYWTDSWMKMIEVATTEGKNRKVLFTFTGYNQPQAILADVKNGYLFWTVFGENMKIERSSLGGNDRKTIISRNDLRLPYDLSIDYTSNKLYWVDSSIDLEYIGVSNLDGSDIQIIRNLTYHHTYVYPFSFTFSEQTNSGYMTDVYTNSLYMISPMETDGKISELYHDNDPNGYSIGQVRTYHTSRNFAVSNPCAVGKNQCSHLCLKENTTDFVCDCPTGMQLHNKTTCKAKPKRIEMIFVDSFAADIYHVTQYKQQPGFVVEPIHENYFTSAYSKALDYHVDLKQIFWSDMRAMKIYQMSLDGSNLKTVKENVSVYALEISQMNNILYYYDQLREAIMAMSIDNIYEKYIFNTRQFLIEDIALHERKGYLFFFTNYYGQSLDGLKRVDIDGKNLFQYYATYQMHITGISVDQIEDRIYVADRYNEAILSLDLNFNDVRTIIQKTYFYFGEFLHLYYDDEFAEPGSLEISGDNIYWTDRYHQAIYETSKRFGGKIEFITAGLHDPRDLHIFKDVVKTEQKKLYFFAFPTTKCMSSNTSCELYQIPDGQLQFCPSGYRESNYGERCVQCNETLGQKHACPCNDWATCAQRTYTNVSGCEDNQPFLKFKVRECVQDVRPGFCPYEMQNECPINKTQCVSDNDCGESSKCCKTACGSKCLQTSTVSDHPCRLNKSKCSHFCMGKEMSYTCDCPENMTLAANKKTCLESSCSINNGRCSHSCIPNNQTNNQGYPYHCSCPQNMVIREDLLNCISDICFKDNGNCSHICEATDNNNNRICKCPSGMILKDDGITCVVDDCTAEKQNGGCSHQCIPGPTSYTCACPSYLILNDSRKCVVRNCTVENGGCSHVCTPDVSTYTCSCPGNMLLSNTDKKTCVSRACLTANGGCTDICTPNPTGRNCSCYGDKILKDSVRCVVNSCTVENGGCSHTCTPDVSTYTCSCPRNMLLSNTDNKTCVSDVCSIENGGCTGRCTPIAFGRTCSCYNNKILVNDVKCVVNSCTIENGGCSHTCTPDVSTYTCSCPRNMLLSNTDNKTCVSDICTNGNGGCSDICTPNPTGRTCSCFNGKTLRDDVRCVGPACAAQNCNGNGICNDVTSGGFECDCSEEYYTGKTCANDLRNQVTTVSMQLDGPVETDNLATRIRNLIASLITRYCSSTPNLCSSGFFRRRRATESSNNFTVSPDDIYIKEYNIDKDTNVLTFSFAVKQPKHSEREVSDKGFLDTSLISTTLNQFEDQLKESFNATSLTVTQPKTHTPADDEGLSSGTIATIVFIVILVFVIIPLVAFFCFKFRHGVILKSVTRMKNNMTEQNIPSKRFENEDNVSAVVRNDYDMGAVGYNKSTEEIYSDVTNQPSPYDTIETHSKGSNVEKQSIGVANPTYSLLMEEQKRKEDMKAAKAYENPVYNLQDETDGPYKAPEMEDINLNDNNYESLSKPPLYASISKAGMSDFIGNETDA